MHKVTPIRLAMIAAAAVAAWVAVPAQPAHAITKQKIEQRVDRALERFKAQIDQGEKYLETAEGALVIPEVRKVSFVVGGQAGKGALRVDGETVGYYRMGAGSIGFQVGYEKADFVFLFFREKALDQFRTSRGWTAGADANVTAVTASAKASASTLKNRAPVAAFVYDKEGLAAGVSVDGTKFTPFVPEERASR